MSDADASPLMRQYREIKRGYPDAILLFRVGDFYEMFYDGRADRLQTALHCPHLSRQIQRQPGSALRSALPCRARLYRKTSQGWTDRRTLRTGGGPETRKGSRAPRSRSFVYAGYADRY